MVFKELCPPALIYLIFSLTQIVIDTIQGLYNTALIKVWVALLFTILLNYLCQQGLGIISWLIVFIPFILMTLIVGILLLMFGLDPTTGKLKVKKTDAEHEHHKHGAKMAKQHGHHPPEPPDDPVGGSKDMLKSFSPYDYKLSGGGGGGGGGTTDTKDEKTSDYKKDKTKRILSQSLLFYSENVEEDAKRTSKNGGGKNGSLDSGASDFKQDDDKLDTTRLRVDVENVTNILYGMGKVALAKAFNDRTLSCIKDTSHMKKGARKQSITYCFTNNIEKIRSSLNSKEKIRFGKNMTERLCKPNESDDACKSRTHSSWWK